MVLTGREIWAVIYGVILGALFLLAYAGGLAELINLGSKWTTETGIASWVRRLITGTWVMAVVAWLTVITGTYIVYPWYRATPPPGADLKMFPKGLLVSSPTTSGWHNFGMEWKEHIAWLVFCLHGLGEQGYFFYSICQKFFPLAPSPPSGGWGKDYWQWIEPGRNSTNKASRS